MRIARGTNVSVAYAMGDNHAQCSHDGGGLVATDADSVSDGHVSGDARLRNGVTTPQSLYQAE